MQKFSVVAASLCVLLWIVLGCGPSGASSPTTSGPRVYFVEPKDGATVSSPVRVKMAADNFKVEPAGDVKSGSGHFHIMIDSDCMAAGQVIPSDATHVHFGKAQTDAELELKPGAHRLCLQMADGAHVALSGDNMKQQINITVR